MTDPNFHRYQFLCGVCVAAMLLIGCDRSNNAAPAAVPAASQSALAQSDPPVTPRVAAYQARIRSSLASAVPVMTLDNLPAPAAAAQAVALADPQLQAGLFADGAALRHEVFAVYALAADAPEAPVEACRHTACYRVEIYDFARNRALIWLIAGDAVVARGIQIDTQPELPDSLRDVAIEIAQHAPEVAEALGVPVTDVPAQMASTKTALNQTRCERAQHLCVAPTFVANNVAIWAIVDLTDLRLVGARWTDLGDRDDPPPTEQRLQDDVIAREYCDRLHTLVRGDWSLRYGLTASDGLQIIDVRYRNQPVYDSVKLVDWHVNYSQREGFGYSDAVGCPNFSSAAVVPFAPPQIEALASGDGFRLIIEFRSPGWPRACNYSYQQSFEFYDNGDFRPTAASIGAGCGNDGTYRPVLRIAPAVGPWTVERATGDGYVPLTEEAWFAPDAAPAADGGRLRWSDARASFTLQPNGGQVSTVDDSAYLYVTAADRSGNEGSGDLLTIGPCCNIDYRQGPEKFIDAPPQALDGAPVFWFVPQLKNDDTPGAERCWARSEWVDGVAVPRAYPCVAGPLIRYRAAS